MMHVLGDTGTSSGNIYSDVLQPLFATFQETIVLRETKISDEIDFYERLLGCILLGD